MPELRCILRWHIFLSHHRWIRWFFFLLNSFFRALHLSRLVRPEQLRKKYKGIKFLAFVGICWEKTHAFCSVPLTIPLASCPSSCGAMSAQISPTMHSASHPRSSLICQ